MNNEVLFFYSILQFLMDILPLVIIVSFFILVINVIQIKNRISSSKDLNSAIFFDEREQIISLLKNKFWRKKKDFEESDGSGMVDKLKKDIKEILLEFKKYQFEFPPKMDEWIKNNQF